MQEVELALELGPPYGSQERRVLAALWRLHNLKDKITLWRLNAATEHDSYPLPHIQDFSAKLAGSTVFSKVNLVKGYHQIPVTRSDVPKQQLQCLLGYSNS